MHNLFTMRQHDDFGKVSQPREDMQNALKRNKKTALMKKGILIFPDFRASFASYLLRVAALRKRSGGSRIRSGTPVSHLENSNLPCQQNEKKRTQRRLSQSPSANDETGQEAERDPRNL